MTPQQAALVISLLQALPGRLATAVAVQNALHAQQQAQQQAQAQAQAQHQAKTPLGNAPKAPLLKQTLGGRGYRQFRAGQELAHAGGALGIPGFGQIAEFMDRISNLFSALDRFIKAIDRFDKAFSLKGGRSRTGAGQLGSGGSGGGPGGGSGGGGRRRWRWKKVSKTPPPPKTTPPSTHPTGTHWSTKRLNAWKKKVQAAAAAAAAKTPTPPAAGPAPPTAPPPKPKVAPPVAAPTMTEEGDYDPDWETSPLKPFTSGRSRRRKRGAGLEDFYLNYGRRATQRGTSTSSEGRGGGDVERLRADLLDKLRELVELQREANNAAKNEKADHPAPPPGGGGDKSVRGRPSSRSSTPQDRDRGRSGKAGLDRDIDTILTMVKLLVA